MHDLNNIKYPYPLSVFVETPTIPTSKQLLVSSCGLTGIVGYFFMFCISFVFVFVTVPGT